MCNLCSQGVGCELSRIQGIPICTHCKILENNLCEILETEELESLVTFSELIVYCDMLRNDMAAEEKDIPFNEYLKLMRN